MKKVNDNLIFSFIEDAIEEKIGFCALQKQLKYILFKLILNNKNHFLKIIN